MLSLLVQGLLHPLQGVAAGRKNDIGAEKGFSMKDKKENNKRRMWTPKRKTEVVLEGLAKEKSIAEICRKHGITQSMYYEWKQIFIAKGEDGLAYGGKSKLEHKKDKQIAKLERKIGQLTMEKEILQKAKEIGKKKLRSSGN